MTLAMVQEEFEPPVDPESEQQVRPLPRDLDAEGVILSAALCEPEKFALISDQIEPRHFFARANRWIYEAIVELSRGGRSIDNVAVAGWLRDRNRLRDVGGAEYLAQLTDSTPAIANIEQHATTVAEFARVRELIATTQKIAAEGYGVKGDEVQGFLDSAELQVYQLAHRDERRDVASMSEVVNEAYQQMLKAEARQGAVELPTGLRELDKKIGGLGRGRVTVLAARPGMGKTSLATVAAENIARLGGVVAIFSLEMPRSQLGMRMACCSAGASVHRGLNGWLHAEERANVLLAKDQLQKLPIWIDDTAAITLMQLRSKARRVAAKAKRKLSLVVVDYLQLMSGETGKKGDTRDRELSIITAGMKRLAKELDCAVLLLSQLNRDVEKRPDKRPTLADLRESGGIEQDADDVVFIYRPEYYLRDKTPEEDKGVAELVVGKQRNGPTGIVRVGFEGVSVMFSNLETEEFQ